MLLDCATAILERSDLDLNIGTGSFGYDLHERAAYLEKLCRMGAVLRPDGNRDVLTLATNGSRRRIRLPGRLGSGLWRARPLRERPARSLQPTLAVRYGWGQWD